MAEEAKLVRRAGLPVGVGLDGETIWRRPRAWIHSALFLGASVLVFFAQLSGRDTLLLFVAVAFFAAVDLFGWMMQQIVSILERIETLLKRKAE